MYYMIGKDLTYIYLVFIVVNSHSILHINNENKSNAQDKF